MQKINTVVKDIVRLFKPEKIILFGSYAHNNPNPDSDVDLLVVMNTEKSSIQQAIEIAQKVEHHFGLDIIVRSPEQLKERIELGDFFLNDIISKGKLVYEHPIQQAS
jgi:predicted nucleotidyltransferase